MRVYTHNKQNPLTVTKIMWWTPPAGMEMLGMSLLSPKSIFLLIFKICTFFGDIKNKFICFVTYFGVSSFLWHNTQNFNLRFLKNIWSNGTDIKFHHHSCSDCYCSISFPTFIHFFVHFWTGNRIHPMPFGAALKVRLISIYIAGKQLFLGCCK